MYYHKSAGDDRFVKNMERGCQYWNDNFFWRRDNQRCSQSIGTLVFLRDRDPENLSLAHRGYSDAALAPGGDVLRACRTLRTVMEK